MKYVISLIFAIFPISTVVFAENSPSFLTADQTPDSLVILPPPPAFNSVAFLNDTAAYHEARSLIGTERWKQAVHDADLSDENLTKPFSAAFGMEISVKNTPVTYDLLKKLRTDSGHYATQTAKQHYMRLRPFVFFNTHSCTPESEASLSQNGSYPSGHTTIGWSTALILAEIRPDRQNEILKRGYEYGQSRVICGVHWQSDVDAGRITGAAEVARLHADPNFIKQLMQAKQEIQKKIKHPVVH
ncbi:phosphatase PAP2 family protein [Acinetobacter qingfengensis]|uniref:Acid phosphatase n=1 Tax=Acinetobacter qingfengensis TaxID=1262585 RepID=A0A1E7R2V7_9GAMM|nr:phosphatase PAP2 family protein [Acinetobacter qingfengensis]KAA8733838.1 phosphatase PAP2 family protein [Acinetobacter qingfengensis]OEY93650.1 phosphatase PAP2 family protein [Acinetobacter qingfengensis]